MNTKKENKKQLCKQLPYFLKNNKTKYKNSTFPISKKKSQKNQFSSFV